tara:strand:- start:1007 stop:1936 length:930 start_codon:yes stop_codon:yes gene_type:complete
VKIFKLDTETPFTKDSLCLTIGNFDGFHNGHQEILKTLKKISIDKKLLSAVMSFDPHPRSFFNKDINNFNIYTKKDKLNFLKDFGIDIYINFAFDKKLSEYSSNEFIDKILVNKLNIKNLIVGSDFKFGKDREGNVDILNSFSKIYNYEINLVNAVNIKNKKEKYSSSLIRKDIEDGNFENVSKSLGRYWHMTGKIVEGQKKARKINFPTANMEPDNHILPKKGVYCVEVVYSGKKYFGISNFGVRPTVDGSKLLLETHIFNFDEEIYGKELTVRFLTFIRSEQKFGNFDLLTEQIKKDIETAKDYLKI